MLDLGFAHPIQIHKSILPMNSSDSHTSTNDQTPLSPWQTTESLQHLIEAAPVAIVTVDRAGTILYVNQKLEDLFGYTRAELIDQPVELLLPEQFRTIHVQHRAAYVAEPHVRAMGSGMNLVGRRKDGTTFPLEAGLSAVTMERRHARCRLRRRYYHTSSRLRRCSSSESRNVRLNWSGVAAWQMVYGISWLYSIQISRWTRHWPTWLAQAGMLLGADACAIFRTAANAAAVDVQVSQGLPESYLAQTSIVLSQETFIGRAVLNRQPLTVPDIAATLADANAASLRRRQALLNSGYRAFMVVPLLIKGDAYGALALYYAAPRNFTAEEVDLATHLLVTRPAWPLRTHIYARRPKRLP